jgi:hypothetical protein
MTIFLESAVFTEKKRWQNQANRQWGKGEEVWGGNISFQGVGT